MLVAGVDIGSGEASVAVVDALTGRTVRHGRSVAPHGTEADPEQWWDAVLSAVGDAGGFKDVAAYSVAAAAGGLVALDAAGRVIRPALVGSDARFTRAARALADAVTHPFEPLRPVPGPETTLAKLRWLSQAEPECAARIEAVALPHDWLVWRLRGFGPDSGPGAPRLEELVTDRSDASGTGYWDPTTGRWDHALFEEALGRPAIKPRVMKPDAWGGESARIKELGIRTGLVTGIGAERLAAALLGLGAGPGDVVAGADGTGRIVAIQDRMPDRAGDMAPGERGGERPICVRADATGNLVWLPGSAGQGDPAGLGAPADRDGCAPDLVRTISFLRDAGAQLSRIVLAGNPGRAGLRALQEASGLPVTTSPLRGAAARGMARQAAWARTTRLPQWEPPALP